MVTPEAINLMLAQAWPTAKVICLEVSSDQVLAKLEPSLSQLRPGGFISGPTQFALADAALWFLASGAHGRVEPMALTSELSIRYLRPAIGSTLYAKAELARAGKRAVVGSVRIWVNEDQHRPTAVAQGTYHLPLNNEESK